MSPGNRHLPDIDYHEVLLSYGIHTQYRHKGYAAITRTSQNGRYNLLAGEHHYVFFCCNDDQSLILEKTLHLPAQVSNLREIAISNNGDRIAILWGMCSLAFFEFVDDLVGWREQSVRYSCIDPITFIEWDSDDDILMIRRENSHPVGFGCVSHWFRRPAWEVVVECLSKPSAHISA